MASFKRGGAMNMTSVNRSTAARINLERTAVQQHHAQSGNLGNFMHGLGHSSKFEEEQWSTCCGGDESSGYMSEWMGLHQALPHLPHAPGLFRLGYCPHAPLMPTEVIFICHTTHYRTLSEVVTSMSFGFEGGERLMMFLVNPENKHKVFIKWRVSVYPEDIIEEEMEEFISEEARVPRYNDPIRPEEEGVWAVVADDPTHPSNNIVKTSPEDIQSANSEEPCCCRHKDALQRWKPQRPRGKKTTSNRVTPPST